jgi:site-specific DNA-methyltransferase (adenine-specific)
MWLYGSGFPKSLDVSKAIDKAAGAKREVVGGSANNRNRGLHDYNSVGNFGSDASITSPSTEAAKKWQGWGTALKPAVEPIVLARKPLIGTVAENVLTHGTGALNIDSCRIGTDGGTYKASKPDGLSSGIYGEGINGKVDIGALNAGRWPANILLDEEAAALLDEQSGESVSQKTEINQTESSSIFLANQWQRGTSHTDSGGASRFFYVAKASRSERNFGLDRLAEKDAPQKYGLGQGAGAQQTAHKNAARANIHPTVKPVDLMRYLIRLVTPKGGTVLDPFIGSGTTGVAAIQEGVNWIGCEREPEYVAIIEARIDAAQPGMGFNLEEDIK